MVAGLLLLSACSSPADPSGVMLSAADSSFAELLADLHAADVDALLSMEEGVFSPDRERRDSVLQANDLDEVSFQQLADVHSADPERFVAIYNRSLDIASRR